ncbi:MAG: hypothetical protein KJ630_05740 [Proteobacteria bacterium]|nr:hypothetical protein [Pseudomonadota bacterium]
MIMKITTNPILNLIKRVTANPYLNLISGLVLVSTAGYEVLTTLEEMAIGAHHGIALFGILQTVKAIPEIMCGFNDMEEGKKKHEVKLAKQKYFSS